MKNAKHKFSIIFTISSLILYKAYTLTYSSVSGSLTAQTVNDSTTDFAIAQSLAGGDLIAFVLLIYTLVMTMVWRTELSNFFNKSR